MDVWNQFKVEIAVTVLTAGAILALKGLRRTALSWLKKLLVGWVSEGHQLDSKTVARDQAVHDYLTELRLELKADRAQVWQFHNGNTFSNSNPIWRLSCTHESCRLGISHEIMELQGILASTMTPIASVLFGTLDNVNVPWLTVVQRSSDLTLPIYFINVRAMPEGYSKSMLINSGSQYALLSPISTNSGPAGYVLTSYCDESDSEVPANYEKISHCAGNVGFLLKGGC